MDGNASRVAYERSRARKAAGLEERTIHAAESGEDGQWGELKRGTLIDELKLIDYQAIDPFKLLSQSTRLRMKNPSRI
jgi:hypothetical protein